MSENTKYQNLITGAREDIKIIWEALARLERRQKEWTAGDYSTNMPQPVEMDNGNHNNAHLTKLEVASVVFDTTTGLRTFFDSGHATNVDNLL